MSRAETFLRCSNCLEKLNLICDKLGYDDSDREVVAEVLLFLEMGKLKEKSKKIDFDKVVRDSKERTKDNPFLQDPYVNLNLSKVKF